MDADPPGAAQWRRENRSCHDFLGSLVRAQAAALYGKAGLSGRAALSAFFLEDLLAPIEKTE